MSGNSTDMTTPTSMGNQGGTVTSCSPYAYPGFAEICILLRTWSTVTPGTYEPAFLIKKIIWDRLLHVYAISHASGAF